MQALFLTLRRKTQKVYMSRFATVAIIGMCVLIAARHVSAQDSIKYPGARGQRIDRITIVGAKVLAVSAVQVLSGASDGDLCTEMNLDEIRRRLIDTGMFGMHNPDDQDEWVRLRVDTSGYPAGHCNLIIVVDENDKINEINIIGSGPIPPDSLLPAFHKGTIYSTAQMKRDTRAIQEMYTSKGYVMAFGPELGIDPAHPGILNVPIVVARVRDIKISGNKTTRAFVIRRELKTKEGGYYNRNDVQADVRHLADLGLFGDMEPIVTPITPEQVSIEMKVTEKKNRSYNFGSSMGGGALAGFVEVSDNNFRGQDEMLGIHVESGIASNRHSYQASFVEPRIDRRSTSMKLNAFDTTSSVFSSGILGAGSVGSSGNLVQQKTGGSLLFQRPIGGGLVVAASFKGESVRTDPLSLAGSSATLLQDGPVLTTAFEIEHSTLDQRADPVQGGLQKLSLGVGHAEIHAAVLTGDNSLTFGSHNFVRSSVEVERFFNLQAPRTFQHPDADRKTVALRFQAGSSTGIMPFTEQYFLGGASGLRGYKDGRFWGQNMASGTMEYRHPLAKGFKGVLFAEAGDAWGGSYQNVQLQGMPQSGFKVHASTGFGIRVGTPAGLVRLDYGLGDEGGRIHFGIGHTF